MNRIFIYVVILPLFKTHTIVLDFKKLFILEKYVFILNLFYLLSIMINCSFIYVVKKFNAT